jgi:hypothetical protein
MNLTLSLSDTLSLIHAPSIGEGKTTAMAKGLFLCEQDMIYAGESAGFGLPVWKTRQHTVFPSLVSARWFNLKTIEKVYRLDLVVTWQIFGIDAPRVFPAAMESITEIYMKQPGRQQFLLNVRGALFALFHIRSTMVPGYSHGECRVLYTTDAQRLFVTVDGQTLQGQGELILLNEAAGLPFNRLRIGPHIQEGNNIPAWQTCPFESVFENPARNLGFSVSLPEKEESSHWRLAGGREVTRGLNWAGLALTTDQLLFSYGINFCFSGTSHKTTFPKNPCAAETGLPA